MLTRETFTQNEIELMERLALNYNRSHLIEVLNKAADEPVWAGASRYEPGRWPDEEYHEAAARDSFLLLVAYCLHTTEIEYDTQKLCDRLDSSLRSYQIARGTFCVSNPTFGELKRKFGRGDLRSAFDSPLTCGDSRGA